MGAGVPRGLQNRCDLGRGRVGSIPTHSRQNPGPHLDLSAKVPSSGKMLKLGLLPIIICAAACVASSASHRAPVVKPKESRYLIGLQLYTVRDDCAKDFPGVLKAVAKMGYSGVEFAGYYGRTAQELRKMLDDDHLKC